MMAGEKKREKMHERLPIFLSLATGGSTATFLFPKNVKKSIDLITFNVDCISPYVCPLTYDVHHFRSGGVTV